MATRNRNNRVCIRVSDEERDLITQKMELAGIRSLRAYITKMAIDGYVIVLDLSEINKMVSLLGNATNNLNQIARRVNETGNIYQQDIVDLQGKYDKLWERVKLILNQLAHIQR